MATKAIKTSKKLQTWQTWPSWPFSLAEFMAFKATIRNESNLGFIKMASWQAEQEYLANISFTATSKLKMN